MSPRDPADRRLGRRREEAKLKLERRLADGMTDDGTPEGPTD